MILGCRAHQTLNSCTESISNSLSPSSGVATMLQSGWSGGEHLPALVQEQRTPSHIMDALHAWLSIQCSAFCGDQRPQPQTLAPVVVPLSAAPPQPSPFSRSASSVPGSNLILFQCHSLFRRFQSLLRLSRSRVLVLCQVHLHVMRHVQALFTSTAPAISPLGVTPPSVSSPFVDLRGPPSVAARATTVSHPEVPVRLTRFVDMSLENFYATMNGMVLAGAFEHVGHASVRVGRRISMGRVATG